MKRSLLDILACPTCQGPLACSARAVANDDVTDGELTCSRCGTFPIRNGVARFVDDGNYAASFGIQWNRFRTTQLDSASGTGLSSARFFAETGWSGEWLAGKLVLDAGCGAGRFVEVAAACGAQVVGVDISSAVDAAAANVASFPNAHIVQASLYQLPFRRAVFDAAYCIGVLQHTPDPPRTLAALPLVLKEGGRLAVVAYERKRWTKLHSKYLLRPLTTRMTKAALLRGIQLAMPVLFAATEILFRLPVFGRFFKFAIPVANYTDEPRLSARQRYDWAILDTFDMLSPAYDEPQTASEVVRVLSEAGLMDLQRRPISALAVIGTKRQK